MNDESHRLIAVDKPRLEAAICHWSAKQHSGGLGPPSQYFFRQVDTIEAQPKDIGITPYPTFALQI
jgi:hypothetical protein